MPDTKITALQTQSLALSLTWIPRKGTNLQIALNLTLNTRTRETVLNFNWKSEYVNEPEEILFSYLGYQNTRMNLQGFFFLILDTRERE